MVFYSKVRKEIENISKAMLNKPLDLKEAN
jgi:hypothetical protein